jgi:hypothetical protein
MSGWHRRKGTFLGMDVLFITTIGRKSGQRRETPVTWFPDGSYAWLIVASAAGAAANPDWYLNLAAASIVVGDILPPWQPRLIEVRGLATVRPSGGKVFGENFEDVVVRIRPARIISVGIESRGAYARSTSVA